MAIKKYPFLFTLAIIGILLGSTVSAGTLLHKDNYNGTFPTGKMILAPTSSSYSPFELPSQIPLWYRYNQSNLLNVKSQPLTYDENSTACGNCDYSNYTAIMNIPIQPHFKPVQTILNLKLDQNGQVIYNSVYNETAYACGNCGGGLGFYSSI